MQNTLENDKVEPEGMDALSITDRQLLVALPYRAGMWMSASDEEGGYISDDIEAHALVTRLEERLHNAESDFVRSITAQTLKNRHRWLSWSQGLHKVPEECGRAATLSRQTFGEDASREYRHFILEIARGVAQAYREKDTQISGRDIMNPARFVRKLAIRLYDSLGGDFASHPANVSEDEEEALSRLSSALDLL